MRRKYETIVETIGRTPVVRINHLAPPDVNLFVKLRRAWRAAQPKKIQPRPTTGTPSLV
jgi:cysteine synthase